jgi:enoyl-CoA hydratase
MLVSSELTNHVMTITVHRFEHRNAVDRPTAAAIAAAMCEFDANDAAYVAVLYGEQTFCAGADLKAAAEIQGRENKLSATGDGPMGPTRMKLTKPVIAAIEGYAVAGGLEMAIWCDLRVAAEDAVLGVFCRRFGVPLVDGGTVRLPRLIGQSRAMDLILTGRPVGAAEALQIGLVNRVVPKGQALEKAQELAASLCEFPQVCMRSDRLSALEQFDHEFDAAMAQEFEKGVAVVNSGETHTGAKLFTTGSGRHGQPTK